MKKHYLWIGAFILMLTTTIYAQDTNIYLINRCIEMDVIPERKENTMYVPISFISKELGAQVKWEKPKVIITKDADQIICIIGNKTAYKNGSKVELSNTPYISNNRTFVPLRSISELLDCKVDYEKQTNRINISPNNLKENDKLEGHMKELNAIDYCVIGNWVYYAVLGPEEGFHKMLLDGTQDTRICDFSNVTNGINGSTSVTSEVKEDYILYKIQELGQYDANGKLEASYPIHYYGLNLSNDTLEPSDQ